MLVMKIISWYRELKGKQLYYLQLFTKVYSYRDKEA